MKKYLLAFIFLLLMTVAFTQTTGFDVFTYQPPEFFTKSELPSQLQFSIKNNNTSLCLITLYKSQAAKDDIMKAVMAQWKEQVVKQLNKADKEPGKIQTEQLWDGWASTLAIGNFYQNKKKAVAMLNSFRKDKITACVVYALSDKSFKGPVETFSKTLHLVK